MPLPKSHSVVRTDRVFLSNHAFSKLVGVHRHTILRAMAKGEIEPAGWLDAGGNLTPIWTPAQTVAMTQLVAAHVCPRLSSSTSPIAT